MYKTKASHLDGGHRLSRGMERDGLRICVCVCCMYVFVSISDCVCEFSCGIVNVCICVHAGRQVHIVASGRPDSTVRSGGSC